MILAILYNCKHLILRFHTKSFKIVLSISMQIKFVSLLTTAVLKNISVLKSINI